ncbi:MAG: thermonuclease family protein, partial [Gammaproteobacteria bacterium]|nr:thermonuclease family protein [Gammaproteobacteria bacterium]
VKSALIREIGGKQVHVSVEDTDKFGRLVGTVTCEGRDVGEWLVQEGHAIAAYSWRYKRVEREARRAKRGMWAHAHNFDPRSHRHRRRCP